MKTGVVVVMCEARRPGVSEATGEHISDVSSVKLGSGGVEYSRYQAASSSVEDDLDRAARGEAMRMLGGEIILFPEMHHSRMNGDV